MRALVGLILLLAGCGQSVGRSADVVFDSPLFITSECGSAHRSRDELPLHISLPPGADSDFASVTGFAVAWWNDRVPGLFVFDGNSRLPNDDSHVTLDLVDVPLDQLAIVGQEDSTIDVLCIMHNTTITINFIHPGMDEDHFNAYVIAHEMGHSIGLAHDGVDGSLMNGDGDLWVEHGLPSVTRDQLVFLYGDIEMTIPVR